MASNGLCRPPGNRSNQCSGVACDGDDAVTGTPVTPPKDSGPGNDSSMMMGTDAGDAATMSVVPKVILVHGANEAGPVRLCIANSPTATPRVPEDLLPGFSPLPFDKPGANLPPGFGAVLPLSALNVAKLNLVPIVIKAPALIAAGADARMKPCSAVLAPADAGGLIKDVDYFILPEVKQTDFAERNTYAAVVVGCPPGITDPAAVAKCGMGYVAGQATHNFRLQTYKLDRTSGGAGNLVQFVHGALAVDAVAGPVAPFIGTNGGDAGTTAKLSLGASTTSQAQAVTKSATTAVTTPAPIDFAKGVVGVTIMASMNDLVQGVGVAQTISNGNVTDPTFFKAGRGYTFIAVGDATDMTPPGPTGFKGAHFLVFDNDPVVPALPQ
jgi:hypothetical protein